MALGLRPGMGINQQVILPRGIAASEEINRTLVVSDPAQEVPTAVRQWMIADPRYNGWFLDGVARPSPDGGVQAAVDNPPGNEPPTEDALVDPAETWRETDNVPALRDYAKRHGVELKSDDKKDEVVEKLRAGRGPFEVQADEGEPKTE